MTIDERNIKRKEKKKAANLIVAACREGAEGDGDKWLEKSKNE